MGRSRLEKRIWGQYTMEVSDYHGENGIFTADEYCNVCDDKGKTQIFQELMPSIIMCE